MIYDTLDRLARYRFINPHIEKIVTFISSTDLHELSEGKVAISGDDAFVNVMKSTCRSIEEAQLETHNQYLDIQVVLQGFEQIGVAPRSLLKESEGYHAENDLEFWKDPCQFFLTMKKSQFALFLPEDGHLPLIGEGKVHKLVFKLKIV